MHTAIVYNSKLNSAEISVSGYKHCATVIIAAALINPDTTVTLFNVPKIDDIKYLMKIIKSIGGSCFHLCEDQGILINPKNICDYNILETYSKHIHGAIYLLPVLLGRFNKVELGNCGGCQIGNREYIGKRPVNHMLSVLEKFGAYFSKEDGKIVGQSNGFFACTIDIMDYSDDPELLTGPLVSGASKTAILAAAYVKNGKTKIMNLYPKPDVTELLEFMKTIGYEIEYGSNFVQISNKQIEVKNVKYRLMSDISQIITYIAISVYHNVRLSLTNITVDKVKTGLKPEIGYLDKMGIKMHFGEKTIEIQKSPLILPLNINVTSVGIYSDHHPFFTLMLLGASGCSTIREFVWKSRFDYAEQLLKLGITLKVKKASVIITPSEPIYGNQLLEANDLRAASVLLIACLKAPIRTTIKGIHHLVRGYDHFVDDLIAMGAKIDVL